MLKSKIEVREFSVRIAADIMGSGTPGKDIVSKAKEIEAYVIGDAELPEVHDEVSAAGGILQDIFNAIGRGVDAPDADIAPKATTKQDAEKKSK